jgi:Flp pilus assembly protein CpaB
VGPGAADADGARQIRPRRGLPGGRAVVGGLLVAVAAVGTFAAVSGAGRGPSTSYVVAARDVEPGSVLTADDVEVVAIDLPDSVRAGAFTRPGEVVGAVAVGPLAEGDLVQAGGLAPGDPLPTFSLALPEADANGGDLQPGDVVQVFATYGSDGGSPTLLLSAEAEVVGTSSLDDTVTSSGEITVKLAVASAEERSAILNAKVTGQISLVRVSGAKAPGAAERFAPDVPGAGSGTTTPEEEDGADDGSSGGG